MGKQVGYNEGMVAFTSTTDFAVRTVVERSRADPCAGWSNLATDSTDLLFEYRIATTVSVTNEFNVNSDDELPKVGRVDYRNQQYSIYALTDSSGAVSERYAYTAYGQPTFLNASATVQTSSAAGNRYTYTSREWDATLGLHHFRARWMSGLTGRFLTRDPIGFADSYQQYEYVTGAPLILVDPLGLCSDNDVPKAKVTIKMKIEPTKTVLVDFKGSMEEMQRYKGTDIEDKAGVKGEPKGILGLTVPRLSSTSGHAFGEMDCKDCCEGGTKGKAIYVSSIDINLKMEITVYYLNWTNAGAQQRNFDRMMAKVIAHENQHVRDAIGLAKSMQSTFEIGPIYAKICTSDEDKIKKLKKLLESQVNGIEDNLVKKLLGGFQSDFNELKRKFHATPAGGPIRIEDYIK